MRLLLGAHASGRSVGERLRAHGHDVRALDAEPENEGIDDEEVLALAAEDRRVLVTHSVADFPEILREWSGAGRSHAGVILVYGIRHNEFGLLVRGVERWLERVSRQEDWIDLAVVLDRAFAS